MKINRPVEFTSLSPISSSSSRSFCLNCAKTVNIVKTVKLKVNLTTTAAAKVVLLEETKQASKCSKEVYTLNLFMRS